MIVADVGIYASDKVKPYLWQTEKTDIHFLPDKIVDGNKGTFGKILVVAEVRACVGRLTSVRRELLQWASEW